MGEKSIYRDNLDGDPQHPCVFSTRNSNLEVIKNGKPRHGDPEGAFVQAGVTSSKVYDKFYK